MATIFNIKSLKDDQNIDLDVFDTLYCLECNEKYRATDYGSWWNMTECILNAYGSLYDDGRNSWTASQFIGDKPREISFHNAAQLLLLVAAMNWYTSSGDFKLNPYYEKYANFLHNHKDDYKFTFK